MLGHRDRELVFVKHMIASYQNQAKALTAIDRRLWVKCGNKSRSKKRSGWSSEYLYDFHFLKSKTVA
jgi:hypothetical protein